MYTFDLSTKYLSNEEQAVFNNYLIHHGLDNSIWEVFSCLFSAGTQNTTPLLLRVYKENDLFGVAIIIKCAHYGRALFSNKILSGLINFIQIPFYLWIKFGCCMDMMSNLGFVKDPVKEDEVFKAIISYLKKNSILAIINDYTAHQELYDQASVLPALPHALVNTSLMSGIQDYMKDHKNLKRKLRVFKNKGGKFIITAHKLNEQELSSMQRCFLSTAEKSVFYLPYQDLYLNSALKTGKSHLDNVYYFIATLNDEFIGYQAAIMSGDHLNALHGAFDRNLKSTYHAYDILFVKMTEFAIEHNLKSIDFGAVLNETKQKMVNETVDMSYFLLSKYPLIQWMFNLLLKFTKVQGKQQMKYRK